MLSLPDALVRRCGCFEPTRHDAKRIARLPQKLSSLRDTAQRDAKGLQTFRVVDARRSRAVHFIPSRFVKEARRYVEGVQWKSSSNGWCSNWRRLCFSWRSCGSSAGFAVVRHLLALPAQWGWLPKPSAPQLQPGPQSWDLTSWPRPGACDERLAEPNASRALVPMC